jgi:hypothetical protein
MVKKTHNIDEFNNRMPHSALSGLTSFESFKGIKEKSIKVLWPERNFEAMKKRQISYWSS